MENTHAEKGNQKVTRLNIVVDGIAYLVDVSPFEFNNEKRFHVIVNDGPTDIFAWDNEMKMYNGLDDQSAILPDGLVIELNKKLLDMGK